MTLLLPKQTNGIPQAKPSFDFTFTESQLIDQDSSGDFAFLGSSAAFAHTVNPHQGVRLSDPHTNANADMRYGRQHQGESPLSPIAEHANHEQAEARIDEIVAIIKQGIEDAMTQARERRTPSPDRPCISHEDLYGRPRVSFEQRIELGLTRGVNKVREGVGKRHKVRWFTAKKSHAVKEEVKARYEAYARRHDIKTFDGEIVEWNYHKIPE